MQNNTRDIVTVIIRIQYLYMLIWSQNSVKETVQAPIGERGNEKRKYIFGLRKPSGVSCAGPFSFVYFLFVLSLQRRCYFSSNGLAGAASTILLLL